MIYMQISSNCFKNNANDALKRWAELLIIKDLSEDAVFTYYGSTFRTLNVVRT